MAGHDSAERRRPRARPAAVERRKSAGGRVRVDGQARADAGGRESGAGAWRGRGDTAIPTQSDRSDRDIRPYGVNSQGITVDGSRRQYGMTVSPWATGAAECATGDDRPGCA